LYLEYHAEIEEWVSDKKNVAGLRRYTFSTLTEIMKYWTELEYISLARFVIEDEEVPTALLPYITPSSALTASVCGGGGCEGCGGCRWACPNQ